MPCDLSYLLEIRDQAPQASAEITPPRDIQAVTWYPQYQQTPHRLNLPAGKKFGITKRVAGIPATRLIEQGTQLQAVYEDVNNNRIPYAWTWSTLRAYSKGEARLPYTGTLAAGQTLALDKTGLNCEPGDIISIHKGFSGRLPEGLNIAYRIPERGAFRFEVANPHPEPVALEGEFSAKYFGDLEAEAEKLYAGAARKGNITAAEICENGIPYDQVEQIFRRIYALLA